MSRSGPSRSSRRRKKEAVEIVVLDEDDNDDDDNEEDVISRSFLTNSQASAFGKHYSPTVCSAVLKDLHREADPDALVPGEVEQTYDEQFWVGSLYVLEMPHERRVHRRRFSLLQSDQPSKTVAYSRRYRTGKSMRISLRRYRNLKQLCESASKDFGKCVPWLTAKIDILVGQGQTAKQSKNGGSMESAICIA